MLIPFNLSGVFTASSNELENAQCLKALLEALIECDLAYLRHHASPKLYDSRVVYGRTEEWERIPDVIRRGYGDCKSLSAWRVAELRKEHIPCKIFFRFVRRDGYGVPDYHILLRTPSTKQNPSGWECPSKKLGMNLPETSYFQR